MDCGISLFWMAVFNGVLGACFLRSRFGPGDNGVRVVESDCFSRIFVFFWEGMDGGRCLFRRVAFNGVVDACFGGWMIDFMALEGDEGVTEEVAFTGGVGFSGGVCRFGITAVDFGIG